MKNINLTITGCMGRMGQQLIKTTKKEKGFKINSLTEYKIINKKFSGIKPQLNTEDALKKTDVIIDFTVPKCTFEVLKIATKLKKRVVIGTTGFTEKEEKLIKSYSKKIPIFLINFSIFFLPSFTKCSGLKYFGYMSLVTLLTFTSVH